MYSLFHLNHFPTASLLNWQHAWQIVKSFSCIWLMTFYSDSDPADNIRDAFDNLHCMPRRGRVHQNLSPDRSMPHNLIPQATTVPWICLACIYPFIPLNFFLHSSLWDTHFSSKPPSPCLLTTHWSIPSYGRPDAPHPSYDSLDPPPPLESAPDSDCTLWIRYWLWWSPFFRIGHKFSRIPDSSL